jgi:ABC-type antimicrobial peptide transport system permease subunit
VQPAAALFERTLRTWRLGATLFTVFGAMAAILAVAGVYTVLMYLVAQRNRELAIRIALGARAADVSWLVLRDTARMTGVGVTLGVAAAAVLARALRAFLYGIAPIDPVVYFGATVVLALAALGATVFPVRRALSVDPAVALRDE